MTTWSVVVLLLAVGVGFMWWQDREHDDSQQAATAAVAAARESAAQVLSYGFQTLDDDLATAQSNLTGKFKDDFAKLSSEFVAPAARQDQIDTKAEVSGSGVVTASPDKVVALLFVNQTTHSSKLKDPKVDGSRIQLTMQRSDDRWLISDLKPV